MLFLVFQLGQDRYAIDARSVADVIPLVNMTRIPQAPAGVAGVFSYYGAPVPAIDVAQMTLGRPAERRSSTRIVVVYYGAGDTGVADVRPRLLGLVVEKATETVRREPEAFVPSGVRSSGAPYLGPVSTDARGLLQRIDVQAIVTDEVREVLSMAPAGSH